MKILDSMWFNQGKSNSVGIVKVQDQEGTTRVFIASNAQEAEREIDECLVVGSGDEVAKEPLIHFLMENNGG